MTPATIRNQWQATSGETALATNASTPIIAAAQVSNPDGTKTPLRNFLTDLELFNINATVSTVVSILDGSTVIWTGYVPAMTATLNIVPVIVNFTTPLKGSVNSALNIRCGTTGASLYWNARGFQASSN